MLSCSIPKQYALVIDTSKSFYLGVSYDWNILLNQAFSIQEKLDLFGCDQIELEGESTPGWFNNGFKDYQDGQELEAFENKRSKLIERANMLTVGLVNPATLEERRVEILNKANEPLQKFPSILSGRLNMVRMPTEEEIELIIEQTKQSLASQKIDMIGWRLVELISSVLYEWRVS